MQGQKTRKILEENKLILAPMEAVNCTAFRLLCKQYGAGWVYSPMIYADSVVALSKELGESEAVKKLVNPLKQESPLSIQIGGRDPEKMKFAAEVMSKHCDFVDINFGCPVNNILGCKAGGYFSKHPDFFMEKVIPGIIEASKVPISAKIRIGWDENTINAVSVCKKFEEIGIESVAIHGRTVQQMYRSGHRWDIIRECKDAVNIPIIANGNVQKASHVITCLGQTKADGIMIARAAQDNPMIFTEGNRILKEGADGFVEKEPDRKKLFFEFLELYKKYEFRYKFTEIRDHALWFSKGAVGSTLIRPKLIQCQNEEELVELFEREI